MIFSIDGSTTSKTLTQVLRYINQGVMEDIFEELNQKGVCITAAQYEVLRFIDRHERPTVKQVAEGLKISSAAATKAIKGLSEGRETPLVRRSRGRDRREVRLESTVTGRDLVHQVRAEISRRLNGTLDLMTPHERQQLSAGLQAFLRAALRGYDDCDAACLRCGVDHADDCPVHQAFQVVDLGELPPQCQRARLDEA